MLDGGDPFRLFGIDAGYRPITLSGTAGREASATIVWETLATLPTPPLIWNAVPFHPHHLNNALSNRTPRACELSLGASFLRTVVALFSIKRIIAVGNVAQKSLHTLGFACDKVRHPAQGGKPQFVAGLRALLALETPNDASHEETDPWD